MSSDQTQPSGENLKRASEVHDQINAAFVASEIAPFAERVVRLIALALDEAERRGEESGFDNGYKAGMHAGYRDAVNYGEKP